MGKNSPPAPWFHCQSSARPGKRDANAANRQNPDLYFLEKMMLPRTIALLAALLIAASASGGEIYKWKDKDGNVHFSDSESASKAQIQNSEKMKLHGTSVTEERRKEAEAIAAKYKKMTAHDEESSHSSTTAPASPDGDTPIAQDKPPAEDKKSKCLEAWRKYRESQDCFAPYVTSRGVRGDAYQVCTEVKQPEFCD
jgi:hypothetical protein